ncbi:MAG: hypothetical protein JWP87_729 [Labilithrix sp.]|nr:hypothetical protein [Labilithrix sp.]
MSDQKNLRVGSASPRLRLFLEKPVTPGYFDSFDLNRAIVSGSARYVTMMPLSS